MGIIAAGRNLFGENGFTAVSLRDVAKAAGMSHPGLLRYFPSKALLVEAVVEKLDTELQALLSSSTSQPRLESFADAMTAVPRFDALTVMLSSTHEFESTRIQHCRRLETLLIRANTSSPLLDNEGLERIAAMWIGLQLISSYLPGSVSPGSYLSAMPSALVESFPTPPHEALPLVSSLSDLGGHSDQGYERGRRRRAQILVDATDRFTRCGYHGTSVREIAESVGVSASTLVHHIGTKEQLLTAVLARRDELLAARGTIYSSGADELAAIGNEARRDTDEEPGLIELYAVVSSEAAAPTHPAHEYLRERYRRTIAYFRLLIEQAQRQGKIPGTVDSWREAVRLVASWDGLQLRALYTDEWTLIGARLHEHVASALFSFSEQVTD